MSDTSTADSPTLRVQRLPMSAALALGHDDPAPFAALAYGEPTRAAWMPGVHARVLLGPEGMADVWDAGHPVRSSATGVARWRSDGQWLMGVIDLDQDAEAEGLDHLARRAYTNLFEALRESGCPHLLRIWNYLPRINADGGGLERYRQFNAGRQQAFIDANQAAFEGAPAACAIGVHQGGLSVRFLAGRMAPLPVENPRQVSAYRYPSTYGPRAPTFSRAALAPLGGGQVALFISGTASIVGHETVHEGDVRAQVAETLTNLRTVVEQANARTTARFALEDTEPVVYVRHADHAEGIRRQLEAELGAGSRFMRQAVFLEADICRSDLLVEIEAHGVAPGTLPA